ncbi:UDP-N-acetylmuramoyl-L-alanine--D-glutamate ligase [Leuconostoc gelidum subsp. gasicomitatum]|uniref:UDP-N-acetylmuramoyl-L-alanine--D-glutamate ligase n=1 Tax=Leuconostoc gasicomitatum TaxID=115778 RepID=UPI001CC6960A|nr:UDP-N-acetylmuramoyl-L-alanine--D-glutamate ligase [Leuconostoc gasicomitatum]MBZ5983872.1 UDP-N-acetylmuramoyl-L-alanine--D-glutamate ligase [Leuconostoc gasicomitatum]
MKIQDFNNKKVMVFGWARSGKAAAQRLLELGAQVTVVNGGEFEDDMVYRQLLAAGVQFINHDDAVSLNTSFDYLIKNPGINYETALVKQAKKLKIPILTEVAVALSSFEGRLIAVTGSNGKTTTTSLIRDMLKSDGQKVTTAGNIGIPVCEVIKNLTADDTLLLELSSFQLMGTPDIRPDIALITNIFANHLDYHGTRENYVAAKFQLTKNQTSNQLLVLNADGQDTAEFIKKTHAKVVEFSRTKNEYLVNTDNVDLIISGNHLMPLSDIKLVGPHNLENIVAAVTVAKLAGVHDTAIRHVLETFGGVEHRLQHVLTDNGVVFYNDSKATDIEATQTALNSFHQPTIWLAGGLDRGDDLMRLLPNLSHVKAVIAFGETQQKIVAVARAANKPVITVDDVEQAVPVAVKLAVTGDVVLLSPAAASWDQYKSFEERGERYVTELKKVLGL